MTTNDFVGLYSTNDIWRGTDTTRCLTDDLNTIDDINNALPSTYAAKNHTHSNYAAVNHTHKASDITSETLPISNGGTGASTASEAISSLGIDTYINEQVRRGYILFCCNEVHYDPR